MSPINSESAGVVTFPDNKPVESSEWINLCWWFWEPLLYVSLSLDAVECKIVIFPPNLMLYIVQDSRLKNKHRRRLHFTLILTS